MEDGGLLLRGWTARRWQGRGQAAIATAAAVAIPLAILMQGLSAGAESGPGGSSPNAAFISIAIFTLVFPLALITFDAVRKMEGMVSQLKDSIKFDSLTRVLSRSYFLDLMRDSKDDGYVCIVDADHFKRINDTFGHGAGDMALIELAHRIEFSAGLLGQVGRLGGEEFGVFFPGISRERAEGLAEGIRSQVARSLVTIGGNEIALTVSIGVAFHCRGEPLRTALTAADVNLFRAKRNGRNKIVFDDSGITDWPEREKFRLAS